MTAAAESVAMRQLPNRYPPHLLENVVYEPVSGSRERSANAIAITRGEHTHDSDRKRRIELVAHAYLEGRMPRLSSTSSKGSQHARLLPPRLRSEAVFYETVPRTRRNVANVAPDNEGEVEGGQAAKRQRIESVANGYNRGIMPIIHSASLKGPLNKGWKNPWAKAPADRPFNPTTVLPRPVQEFEHITVATPQAASHVCPLTNRNRDSGNVGSSLEPQQSLVNSDTQALGYNLPQQAVPTPAAEQCSVSSPVNDKASKQPSKKKVKKGLIVSRVDESSFPFRYQRDTSNEIGSGATKIQVNITPKKADTLRQMKGPRRMNFDSSQDIADTNKPEVHPRQSPPTSELRYARNTRTMDNATVFTLPSRNDSITVISSPKTDKAAARNPLPTEAEKSRTNLSFNQHDTITVAQGAATEKTLTKSSKKRKEREIPKMDNTSAQKTNERKTRPQKTKKQPARLSSPVVVSPNPKKKNRRSETSNSTPGQQMVNEPLEIGADLEQDIEPINDQIILELPGTADESVILDESVPDPVDEAFDEILDDEQDTVQDLETVQATKTLLTRKKSRLSPIPSLVTSGALPKKTKMIDNRADSRTLQGTVDEPMSSQPATPKLLEPATAPPKKKKTKRVRAGLEIPTPHQVADVAEKAAGALQTATFDPLDPSSIFSKKSTTKNTTHTGVTSTPLQAIASQITMTGTQSNDEDMLDHIFVKPRVNKKIRPEHTAQAYPSKEKSNLTKNSVESTTRNAMEDKIPSPAQEDMEVDFTSQEVEEFDAVGGAQVTHKSPAEASIHVIQIQDESEHHPSKKRSRSSALDPTDTPTGLSGSAKRKRQRTGRSSDHITTKDVLVGAAVNDSYLSQEVAREERALNEPKTPGCKKRAQPPIRTNINQTRFERRQNQATSFKLSPHEKREYIDTIDYILQEAEDGQSGWADIDVTSEATSDVHNTPIIPFSMFKTGVANKAIVAAMSIAQPMSTQQLFEAQSPIVFSTEKKRKIPARLETVHNDGTQYQDTQAMFDAAGQLTPDSNDVEMQSSNDEAYTSVKGLQSRRVRRQEVLHSSRISQASRYDVSGIDRHPFQENPSSSNMNKYSGSRRKSSRLSMYHEAQQLSQPSQSELEEDGLDWVNEISELSPLEIRV